LVSLLLPQVQPAVKKQANAPALNDTAFVNLKEYSNDFVYDMKYATEDNFWRYTIVECYLRLKTVAALVEANKEFIKKRISY
jgi:D-alanyl-D-alanine dipeptidase